MTAGRALSLLAGEAPGIAYGMTWATPDALRLLTWGSGVETEPEALQAVAVALKLDLALVDSSSASAFESVQLLKEADVAAAWAVAGVLTRVAERQGWSEAMIASANRPGELAYLLDTALHALLEDVRRGAASGADVLVIADELSSASGWLVSPDYALDALAPCYARALEEWGDGRLSIFHSDGDVRVLYPQLKKAGFSAIHLASVDTEKLPALAAAAADSGLRVAGGIDTSTIRNAGARKAAELAVALLHVTPLLVTDDGGMTGPEEIAAFSTALDVVRSKVAAEGVDE